MQTPRQCRGVLFLQAQPGSNQCQLVVDEAQHSFALVASARTLTDTHDAKIIAASLFVAGGALVDYQWFGVACVLVATWAIPRGFGVLTLPALFAALLWPINGNW